MNLIRLFCAVSVFSIVSHGLAAEGPKKVASVEGITEYQFDNGLRVLLFPDPSQSKFTVNLTVLVGSRREGYGETGMAHLLEHMVFKGTPRHPNIPKALNDHGAQWNGSTSQDRVNYYETLAAGDENLDFAIDLEADRLVNSFIKKEDLDSEMTVVRNEFERGENSPTGVLMQRIEAAAYDWHNYGKSTIGNRTDIERVPIVNLQTFYHKFYQPDNVVLVVAGKFDEAKALALVQKYFGPIPRPQRKLDTSWTEEPPQDGERQVILRRVGDVATVAAAYHIPAGSHEDMAALQVLANVLSAQPSGWLYKALVETKKASAASASARAQHDPGLLIVQAQVPDEGALDEVRELLTTTVERIGTRGVTTEEVNRAKQQMLRARERAANDTAQVGLALSEWVAQGDWRLYFLQRDRIEQVTPEAVQAVATRYFLRNNRTMGTFIPTLKAERVTIPPTPDAATLLADYKGRPPAAEGEAFEATPANVEGRVKRFEIPEGIKVTLLTKKTRGQEAHVTLTLRYGNEINLKGMEPATGFLAELMMRGTKKLTQQQLRDEMDRLGATFGGGGGRGGRGGGGASGLGTLGYSIQAKGDKLPAVLELLRQVLREPLLPESDFQILKRARLASLEQSLSDPSAIAGRTLQRQLTPYPADDIRYVPTLQESVDRLKATSYEQVARLYKDYLGSQMGELTIVGDFDPDACVAVLKDTLGGWKASQACARIAVPNPPAVPGAQQRINTPDKANAVYVAGMEFAMRDDDPDYPAMLMGNYIFGSGALSSRLGTRVRQQDGLSLSVGSSLTVSPEDHFSAFGVSAICNPQNIDKVAKDVREELDRLVRDGITADELDKARQGWLQAQKVGRSTDAALTGLLGNLRHLDRTMNHQSEVEAKIGALTAEKVNEALRRHLDSKKLVVVTAGDFPQKAEGIQ